MDQAPALKQSGFTLIEVISIFILIGVVGAILTKHAGNAFTSNEVITELAILKANLRYAQMRSMNSTYEDIWRVTLTSGSYTLQQYDSATSTWKDRSLPVESSDPDADGLFETHAFPSGISKSAGASTIRFDNWGIPVQSDRTTAESSNLSVTLTNGSEPKSITIIKNTGLIP